MDLSIMLINEIPLSKLEGKVTPVREARPGSLLLIANGDEQALALRFWTKVNERETQKAIVFLEGQSAWTIKRDAPGLVSYAIDVSETVHLVLSDPALREVVDAETAKEGDIKEGDIILGQVGAASSALLLAAKINQQQPQTVYVRLNGEDGVRCERVMTDPFPAIRIGRAAVAPRKMSDRLSEWLSRAQ